MKLDHLGVNANLGMIIMWQMWAAQISMSAFKIQHLVVPKELIVQILMVHMNVLAEMDTLEILIHLVKILVRSKE